MAREPKGRDGPIGIRLPPDVKSALETAAERNHRSLHGEIVDRLAASVRGSNYWDRLVGWAVENQDPDVAAIRTATLAMLDAAHGGLGDVLGRDFVLGQFQVAMNTLFDALKVEDPAERTITEAAAGKAIAEMRTGGQTPLGEAGRVLGLAKEAQK